jgi:hypothetical protein
MAGANLELARQGGRLNTATGQLLTSTDVDRIGDQALQTQLHQMMVWYFDAGVDAPASGFPRSRGGASDNHCRVDATGDLSFLVQPGWGLFFDASQLGADEWAPEAYLPIVLPSAFASSLAAHDPTNPRIDLVIIQPMYVEDQNVSRNIKNPTTGEITSQGVNQRRRFSAQVQVVTGTPAASPVAPSVPAGWLRIASAEVPATAGAAVWFDDRPMVELGGDLISSAPPERMTLDHVADDPIGQLLVEEIVPNELGVWLNPGRATISGQTRAYPRTKLAIGAADPTDPRIDTVVVADDGTVFVVPGSPDPSPVPAGLAKGFLPVAYVTVPALAASVGSGDIEDVRVFSWVDPEQVRIGDFATRARTYSYPAIGMSLLPSVDAIAGLFAWNVPLPAVGVDAAIGVSDSVAAQGRLGQALQVCSLPQGSTITALRLAIQVAAGPPAILAQCRLYRIRKDIGTLGNNAEAIADVQWAAPDGAGFVVKENAAIPAGRAVVNNEAYSYVINCVFRNDPAGAADEVQLLFAELDVSTNQLFS